MNLKRGCAIAATAALLSIILTSVIAQQSGGPAQPPEPDRAQSAVQFPVPALSKTAVSGGGKPRQHEVVMLRTVLGYHDDYHYLSNYYQGVYVCTSSAGAPKFEFGDNAAEAIATLLEQGYTLQGNPQTDQYGLATSLLFTR